MKDPSKAILNLVSESDRRLAVDAVVQTLSGPGGFPRRELRLAIRKLVDSGELGYSYELGQSFLINSFNRPVSVSPRITLAPPGHRVRSVPPEITVTLAAGAAFGDGQHPTTRMALQAIDTALAENPQLVTDPGAGVLDLGTGSGVLVIAAVLLGIPGGRGVDIDPCALSEARRNVDLNGLRKKIVIENTPVESQPDRFSMITANLRLPTLDQYSHPIARRVEPGGILIVSGIKTDEQAAIEKTYAGRGLKTLRVWNEKGWRAVMMQKY
ncbi:MAG: methyltransferase domain-containing protein [Desulfobacterales bacterium]|nr:methyltransferase domain-containing protein [Desulfobacterales bacterium]